jgi:hypothetical protein
MPHAGTREGHEPYRHLATQLALQLLAVSDGMHGSQARATPGLRSKLLLPCLPQLVTPIRLGLQTREPHLVGHMLCLIQSLLRSHPRVAGLLAPHSGKWMPAIAVFWGRRQRLALPPPNCLPSTGRHDGVCFRPQLHSFQYVQILRDQATN